MRSTKPRFWQRLERHPIGAEYENVSGEVHNDLVRNLREHGFDKSKPITLHDGKVLDGWQRQCAAVAADTKPVYRELPMDVDPRQFVEQENDLRRHETPESVKRRAEQRRKRVAAALREGKSERRIANEESVSQSTIHADKQVLTDQGQSVLPPEGKVTGTDGRQQPSQKPSSQEIVCSKCKRLNSGKSLPGCPTCAELKEEAKANKNREPGIDTAEEKKQRRAERENRNGRIAFDTGGFRKWFGQHLRWLDDLARSLGQLDEKGYVIRGKEHQKLQEIAVIFQRKFWEWEQRFKPGAGE